MVNVTGTQGWCATLCHPMMHQHTKFGIPTSNNIGDMLRTRLFLKLRCQGKGHSDLNMLRDTLLFQYAPTHQIWNSYLKEYRRYAPDMKRDGRTDGLTDGQTDGGIDKAITVFLPQFLWWHKTVLLKKLSL